MQGFAGSEVSLKCDPLEMQSFAGAKLSPVQIRCCKSVSSVRIRCKCEVSRWCKKVSPLRPRGHLLELEHVRKLESIQQSFLNVSLFPDRLSSATLSKCF